jgi:hypothetical protein
MTDGDDETPDAEADGEDEEETSEELVVDVGADELGSRLDDAAEDLEAAETEADLDDVEAELDDLERTLEAAELPEADDEDEEDPREALESRLADLREDLEEQRGPYAEDVVSDVEAAQSTLTETRWTATGEAEIVDVVNDFLASAGDALDTDFGRLEPEEEPAEALAHELDAVADAVGDADLDADADSETLAALVEATDALAAGLEDAEEWDDLETNEKLQAQGFYDVLGHYKDFPVEWAALKEHEQQNNVDMVLLALDSLASEFMERHCLEALERLGPVEAFEEMHGRAEKRDKPAIRILGKIGDERAVETLLEYVDADSDPGLQKVTFKALGEIGSEEATQALANKLAMEDDNVRPYAARALGLLGDTRAVDPLADTLENDESDTVRAAAAWALRQIGTEAALEAAADHTNDRAFLVQTEAETAADALDAAAAEA